MNGTAMAFVALFLVAATAALWFRAALAVRLPKNRAAFVAAWVGGAVLGAVALLEGAEWAGGTAAVLALVAGSFLTFTVLVSRQTPAPDAITVGNSLPEFSATDEHGETFKSASLAGHPVLIKFFRGHW